MFAIILLVILLIYASCRATSRDDDQIEEWKRIERRRDGLK